MLRTNGESFDATDILKDMRAHGVDIGRVSGKAMSEMLKGNKTALPGASGNSVFAYCQGTGGLRPEGLPDCQTGSFGCRSGNMIKD